MRSPESMSRARQIERQVPEPSASNGRMEDQPIRRIKRRSRIVCIHCHEKKVKCDIAALARRPCSRCDDLALDCQIRPSRRNKRQPQQEIPSLSTIGLDLPRDEGPPSLVLDGQAAGTSLADNHDLSMTQSEFVPSISYHQLSDVQADATITQQSNNHIQPPPSTTDDCSPATQSSIHAIGSYVGNTGYLHIFKGHGVAEAEVSDQNDTPLENLPSPALQESFLETYFSRCYAWCPVLDRDDSGLVLALSTSPLLQNALSVIGSHLDPPVLPHASALTYYERAKQLFYQNWEKNPLLGLSAITLFYWWGHGPPDVVSIDTVWWWTGVAIRQAQQLGLHRELRPGQQMFPHESPGLRRRIWWTLFARERLTCLCTGRPVMINPDDCNVLEPTLADFPPSRQFDAEIFIHWVKLCGIIGRVRNHLARRTEITAFPEHLIQELKFWVSSLPPHMQLPIQGQRTVYFNANIHQLHIPYLTTVTLLYLSEAQSSLPRPYNCAVLASTCIARIFEDYTARGSMRFLQGISGWAISVAILALLHARKVPKLKMAADNDIHILRIALKEMGKTWVSARMFERGFERISKVDDSDLNASTPLRQDTATRPRSRQQSPTMELSDHPTSEVANWQEFFPYLTPATSSLASIILETPNALFGDILSAMPTDFAAQFQDFFGPFGDLSSTVFNGMNV